jgi:hypothetical protein
MPKSIFEVEEGLGKCRSFIFDLNKFFSKNPEIAEMFEKFRSEKEDLIF